MKDEVAPKELRHWLCRFALALKKMSLFLAKKAQRLPLVLRGQSLLIDALDIANDLPVGR